MRKILTIAKREYLAGVRTKAFLVSLILMPVMMGGSIGLSALSKKLDDTSEKTYAVVDRSPGGKIAAALEADAVLYNTVIIKDPDTGKQIHPALKIEVVTPNGTDDDAIKQQRFDLSERARKNEIEAFIEIGPDIFATRTDANPEKAADTQAVRLQSKRPGEGFLGRYLERRINDAVQRERFARENVDPAKVRAIQQPISLKAKGLTAKIAQTGAIEDAADEKRIANFLLPGILIGLMFMVIMFGASPAMNGVVEEKGQRIAEVLLGSVTPFELMAGKLLGLVGIALTTAAIYFGGGFVAASRYGLTDSITPELMVWFFVFLTMALLIFGSIFIAVGAAAQDVKDTQTLLTPVMFFMVMPMFAIGPILMDPHGKLAVICSLIPTSAPMILVARQSVPPGVPLVQLLAGAAIVALTTVACVWAAGRIFRVGFLMQGKSPKLKDIGRWIVKG
jgi:ABC-2 type transport system permease protein